MIVICGHENSDIDNDHWASCFATMELKGRYSVLSYGINGSMNSVFTISFFPSKLKYVQ